MPTDKPEQRGPFAADIADEAIAAALRSVEAHVRGNEAGPVPAETDSPAAAVGAEVEAVAPAAPAKEEPATTVPREDLLERIAALERERALKDPLFEDAMHRCRETTERLQEANERMVRLTADLENLRKRAQREKEEIRKFGIEDLLKALLPVLDNLDRAIDAASSCTDVSSFAAGVEMTRRLFEDTLGRFGVKGFRSLGETFDPHVHEAVQGVESQEHPANVIVQEVVRGFFLHDRLARAAMVVVSRGPGPGTAPNPDSAVAEKCGDVEAES